MADSNSLGPSPDRQPALTDTYFKHTRRIVQQHGECEVEYAGSSNLLKMFIMREFATKIDKDGSKLLRMESDKDPPGNEAHVFCQEIDDGFKFQVWADGSELLVNLSIAEAIASYIELCFTHNLKYPKVSLLFNN